MAKPNSIQTVYLIHHSHTDFGFTDLPATCWELHVDFIRRALEIAARQRGGPREARFRWTCESMLVVERFLAEASRAEKRQFEQLVAAGDWEVTGMPHNTSSLMDAAEWQAMMERLRPLYAQFKPVTVFQNDINGLPWGMIPAWHKVGLKYVWMGVNVFAGGTPETPPALWRWEGPTGRRLLTYLALTYNAAYFFLHREEWRRGPVPPHHDVWFNEPGPDDIYSTTPEALRQAHEVMQERIHKQLAHYTHPIVALQATNQYRYDNDPPVGHMPDFVRAWNAAKLSPALRLSTCREFMNDVQLLTDRVPVRRGDWCDWWANGPASMPAETSVNQNAKRRLVDISRAAKLMRSSPTSLLAKLRDGWFQATMYDEHTFGSIDTVAQPYGVATQGEMTDFLQFAYRADECGRLAQAEVIRQSAGFRPFSRTRRFCVFNPGRRPRSGWVEISAIALRRPANAVRDLATGELIPLEDIHQPAWSEPGSKRGLPFEYPNDCWAFTVVKKRFRVAALAPGRSRKFELVETAVRHVSQAGANGQNEAFAWKWDRRRGYLASLVERRTGLELVDRSARHGLGGLVIEFGREFGARTKLQRHTKEGAKGVLATRVPRLLAWSGHTYPSSVRFATVWSDPSFHRVEQSWDFFTDGLIELSTTLWIKEQASAQAFYLAFPFSLPRSIPSYFSHGFRTRVGRDQLPGSCGEYAMVHEGVEFAAKRFTLALGTPDTPIGSFAKLHGMNGQQVFRPDNAHFYSMLHNNYWTTNFPITRAAKLTVRHVLAAGARVALTDLGIDLWAFPTR